MINYLNILLIKFEFWTLRRRFVIAFGQLEHMNSREQFIFQKKIIVVCDHSGVCLHQVQKIKRFFSVISCNFRSLYDSFLVIWFSHGDNAIIFESVHVTDMHTWWYSIHVWMTIEQKLFFYHFNPFLCFLNCDLWTLRWNFSFWWLEISEKFFFVKCYY